MELMQANAQWQSRQADERFETLAGLRAAAEHSKSRSTDRVLAVSDLTIKPSDNGKSMVGLEVVGPSGNAAAFTNWSFGQICQRAGAPKDWCEKIAAPLAADNINYGLKVLKDTGQAKVLLTRPNGHTVLRAITGPEYGRVWDADVIAAVINECGDEFTIPGEFGKQVTITKDNTTLFRGDRDMFIFLADEQNRIEVPNRRNGKSGTMARGFFVSNSEVGAKTLSVSTFLFDYVCSNRIVWGASEVEKISVRHTAKAPQRLMSEVMPAIRKLVQRSAEVERQAIMQAQATKLDKMSEFMATRFGARIAERMAISFQAAEQRPMETLFDAVTAATQYAQLIPFQDKRVEIERSAGELLKIAA